MSSRAVLLPYPRFYIGSDLVSGLVPEPAPRSVVYQMYASYMSATMSTRELRDQLADVLADAGRNEVTIVTSRGREVAAVVPIEMLRDYRRLEEREVVRILEERRASDTGNRHTLDDVMAETLAREA